MKDKAYAFPTPFESVNGITRRELFAAMVMQGLSANPNWATDRGIVASDAVQLADALIEELDS